MHSNLNSLVLPYITQVDLKEKKKNVAEKFSIRV